MDIKAYPRTIVFLSWLLTIIFVSSWRFVIKEFVELYLGKDFFQSRFVIIGTGENASEVANEALRDVGVNHKLLGFVITNKSSPLHVPKSSLLGDIDKMASIIKYYRPDEVVIAESKLDKNSLTKLIDLLSRKKIAIKSVSSAYETVIQNMVLYGRGPTPFMGSTVFKKTFSWYWSFKRILDILFSLILLIITLPICLVICVLIKITSPGPVLYLQKRTGLNGKPFIIFKFRTMYIGAEKKGHPHWTRESDARVTLLGRFLRRFRLDELPQLVNVLRNEMSLIGPRPERPYFTSRLIKKIPFYVERLHVKPGISGWAQVGFRYGATEKDAECKLIYDLYYIQNISLSFDFLIALKTLKTVITGSGAQ